jgi:hypothetical protein
VNWSRSADYLDADAARLRADADRLQGTDPRKPRLNDRAALFEVLAGAIRDGLTPSDGAIYAAVSRNMVPDPNSASGERIGGSSFYEASLRSAELDEKLMAYDKEGSMKSYQVRVRNWVLTCFGVEIADDVVERSFRFLEESLELVQSLGCTRDNAMYLVDYVYGRPVGDPRQEAGGVEVTLNALCSAAGIDVGDAAEQELERVWVRMEKIREKQRQKPRFVSKHSTAEQ